MVVLVVVLLLEVVFVYVLVKVGEVCGMLEMVVVGFYYGDVVMLLLGCSLGYGGMVFWSGGGVFIVCVGYGVVEFGGVDFLLVRVVLVFDYGGFFVEVVLC